MNIKKIVLFSLAIVILTSCNQNHHEKGVVKEVKEIIINDNDRTEYDVLADTVKYLVQLDKDTNIDRPPFFIGFDKVAFIQQMVDTVLARKVEAYDLFDNRVMTIEELKKQLGMITDTLFVEDTKTGEMQQIIVEGQFDPNEVREMYLIERWLYSPSKVKFKTEVIGFAPVRYTVKDDMPDGEVRRVILFAIFPNKKMINEIIQ